MKKNLIIILCLFPVIQGWGQGHGPLYGLQTPTLAKGGFDFNAAAMSISSEGKSSAMLRYMWSYGLTEDVQLNLTTPTVIKSLENPPRTRGNSNMPANGDIEASVWYRFFSNAFDVGKRFESTLILGTSAPTTNKAGNSVHAGWSTGYASRTWYAWIGGGYQYYFERDNTQLGDLPYVSVLGAYRPEIFKEDYPKPDWRVFVESLAEFPANNKIPGETNVPPARNKKVLIGPSFLGLYGAWGISVGALFPVYQNVNQNYQQEDYRLSLNISYWL